MTSRPDALRSTGADGDGAKIGKAQRPGIDGMTGEPGVGRV